MAEYLYSYCKKSCPMLAWPGVATGALVTIAWWIIMGQGLRWIIPTYQPGSEEKIWQILAILVYQIVVVIAGGVYFGSLIKWRMIDHAVRRFMVKHIDTPQCLACGYGLTGVPRSADGVLRCPECTQDWPWLKAIPYPRPYMAAIDGPSPLVREPASDAAPASRDAGPAA